MRLAILMVLISAALLATDLRGRVVRADAYQGIAAAGGVRFTLQNGSGQTIGKSVISGGDGFYYLYNVAPGSYRLLYDYTNRRTGQLMHGQLPVAVRSARTQDIVQIRLAD
jgi:hypothetical protein